MQADKREPDEGVSYALFHLLTVDGEGATATIKAQSVNEAWEQLSQWALWEASGGTSGTKPAWFLGDWDVVQIPPEG